MEDFMDEKTSTPALLTRTEAARFLTEKKLRIAAATLAKKAVTGGGPPYIIWNRRALYDRSKLLGWAISRLSPEFQNTAQRDMALGMEDTS
jgi:hypothetical protein